MSQRKRYNTRSSAYGWEGMMEGSLRVSAASKYKEEVPERTRVITGIAEPGTIIVHDDNGT